MLRHLRLHTHKYQHTHTHTHALSPCYLDGVTSGARQEGEWIYTGVCVLLCHLSLQFPQHDSSSIIRRLSFSAETRLINTTPGPPGLTGWLADLTSWQAGSLNGKIDDLWVGEHFSRLVCRLNCWLTGQRVWLLTDWLCMLWCRKQWLGE